MSLYKNFATESDKEVNGVEIPFEPNDDGSVPTFIIARSGGGNKPYLKALKDATKPYERQIALKTLDAETDAMIYKKVFASYVIKGWQNVQDENGAPLAYTAANAVKLMSDLPDLYSILQSQSNEAALFRKTVVEEQSKN